MLNIKHEIKKMKRKRKIKRRKKKEKKRFTFLNSSLDSGKVKREGVLLLGFSQYLGNEIDNDNK